MLTADKVERAAAALAANQIPHPDDLREMMAAWKRMQAGTSFQDAIGESGTIAKKERNAAIVKMAQGLDGGAWANSETVRLRLRLTPTSDAAKAAIALGADQLSRDMLYIILRDAIQAEPDDNLATTSTGTTL